MSEQVFVGVNKVHKPVCISPQRLEVWVIPFDFEDPFLLGEACSLCDVTTLIAARERVVLASTETVEGFETEWNENDIYPLAPQRVIEVYGDIKQSAVQSVVDFVHSAEIVAAYEIDWDESDCYVVIRNKDNLWSII